jgi:hypothetical protein
MQTQQVEGHSQENRGKYGCEDKGGENLPGGLELKLYLFSNRNICDVKYRIKHIDTTEP